MRRLSFGQIVRKSLEHRLANGSMDVGWSCVWTIGLFARLGDGNRAHDYTPLLRICHPGVTDWEFVIPFTTNDFSKEVTANEEMIF